MRHRADVNLLVLLRMVVVATIRRALKWGAAQVAGYQRAIVRVPTQAFASYSVLADSFSAVSTASGILSGVIPALRNSVVRARVAAAALSMPST